MRVYRSDAAAGRQVACSSLSAALTTPVRSAMPSTGFEPIERTAEAFDNHQWKSNLVVEPPV